jgi:hypothetical protein
LELLLKRRELDEQGGSTLSREGHDRGGRLAWASSDTNGDVHGGDLQRRTHGEGRKKMEWLGCRGGKGAGASTGFYREGEGRGESAGGEKMTGISAIDGHYGGGFLIDGEEEVGEREERRRRDRFWLGHEPGGSDGRGFLAVVAGKGKGGGRRGPDGAHLAVREREGSIGRRRRFGWLGRNGRLGLGFEFFFLFFFSISKYKYILKFLKIIIIIPKLFITKIFIFGPIFLYYLIEFSLRKKLH